MILKKKKASMSVEMSLLMPIVITVVLMLFYLLFFIYNRSVMSQSAYIAALRGSMLFGRNNAEIEEYTRTEAENLIRDRLVMNNEIVISIDVKVNEIRVAYTTAVGIPDVIFLDSSFLTKAFELEECGTAVRLEPASLIQGVNSLRKAAEALQAENTQGGGVS